MIPGKAGHTDLQVLCAHTCLSLCDNLISHQCEFSKQFSVSYFFMPKLITFKIIHANIPTVL